MSTAVVKAEASTVKRFDPFEWQTAQDMLTACEYFARSQFVPAAFRDKPADIALAVQYGRDLGLAPLQALQNIAVINGRPSVWGDLIVALLLSHPDYAGKSERYEGTGENVTAICLLRRKNRLTGELEEAEARFSTADAKKAGLLGKAGPWTQYPTRMLMWRARSFAIRDLFADALKGIMIREEAEDIGGMTVIDKRPTSGAAGFAAALANNEPRREVDPEFTNDAMRETLKAGLAISMKAFDDKFREIWRDTSIRADIGPIVLELLEAKVRVNGLNDLQRRQIEKFLATWEGLFSAANTACEDAAATVRSLLDATHDAGAVTLGSTLERIQLCQSAKEVASLRDEFTAGDVSADDAKSVADAATARIQALSRPA